VKIYSPCWVQAERARTPARQPAGRRRYRSLHHLDDRRGYNSSGEVEEAVISGLLDKALR